MLAQSRPHDRPWCHGAAGAGAAAGLAGRLRGRGSARRGAPGPARRRGRGGQDGRWDEALALSREILERTAPAPVTRLCPLTRAGTILGRRGDPQAWTYLDEAIAAAEGTGEPQSVVPVRL